MKSIWTSKTFWLNILALSAAVAAAFGYTGELSAEWATFVPAIVAVLNIILRLVTKKPISGRLAGKLRGEW